MVKPMGAHSSWRRDLSDAPTLSGISITV
jgi:hypothetical protein